MSFKRKGKAEGGKLKKWDVHRTVTKEGNPDNQ